MPNMSALEGFLPSAVKGLGLGAGMAVPGALLVNHLGNRADESVDHARNQALLTALGLGALGAGGLAIQKKLGPKGVETETTGEGPMGNYRMLQKTKMSYDLGFKQACAELGIKESKVSDFAEKMLSAAKPAAAEATHPLVGKSINLHSLVHKGPSSAPTNFANSPNLKGKTIAIKSLAGK